MVIKSRSRGRGPKKVSPIEINVFNQERLKEKTLEESMVEILVDELHMYGKIESKHPSIKGHNVSDFFQDMERSYRRDHGHQDKVTQDEPKVLFVTFDNGVLVNLHETLTYKSKIWRVKSVKTKTQSLFLLANQFFEAKVDGCVLFSEASVNEVTFIAFEVAIKSSESNLDTDNLANLAYKNAETIKLRSKFDTRKTTGILIQKTDTKHQGKETDIQHQGKETDIQH